MTVSLSVARLRLGESAQRQYTRVRWLVNLDFHLDLVPERFKGRASRSRWNHSDNGLVSF